MTASTVVKSRGQGSYFPTLLNTPHCRAPLALLFNYRTVAYASNSMAKYQKVQPH